MIRWILLMALLASPGLSQKAEKRRAFYRRTTTTTAAPVQKEIESTESKQTDNGGEGLYTVGDSFAIGASSGDNVGKGSSFKPITSNGDKLTSFSEYNFGGTKLSDSSDPDSDEDYGLAPRNHKPQLPISSTNSYKPSGSFDFFNNDYSKPSLDTKPKTSITSKFSISHPTPTKNTYTGRLDHLDDSSEYDLYSNLKIGHNYKSALQSYTGGKSSPFSTFSGSPLSFEGKVKKLPSSYDDYGLSTITTKNKKNKLSLDDDTFGGTGGSYGISNNFGVGKVENFFSGGGKKKNPYGFGEPPLVKSAVSTLKNFGEGLLGASIAAKGQIENFLNAEHGFKATTHFLDGHPGKKPTYQQFLKSQEDEKLEKEALKAQIEYLKAHASKRPSEIRQRPPGPPGPPFPQHPVGPQHAHGGRGRPVRRIPGAHLPLGVKAPHPAPRIPHFNDRPYSISFKL